MLLKVKIKSRQLLTYANKLHAQIISHSGKTLSSIKLKNQKFKRFNFNLKNASYTDDDLKPSELVFIDKNGDKPNFFREKGHHSNGLDFSPNAPKAFPLALKKRDFSKNRIRRVIKFKSDHFTDTSPATDSSYEFFKAGDYDNLNYSEEKALERYGKDLFSFSKRMMEASRDTPKNDPVNFYLLFGDSISQDWRNKVNHWYELMFEIFGAYDNYIHAIWDPKYGAESVVQKMDKLGFFSEVDVKPSAEYLASRSSCLSGFNPNSNSGDPYTEYGFCNQADDLYSRVHETGSRIALELEKLNEYTHEYFHHVQGRTGLLDKIFTNTKNELTYAPAWYIEGVAMIIPDWLIRDEFNNTILAKQIGVTSEDLVNPDYSGNLSEIDYNGLRRYYRFGDYGDGVEYEHDYGFISTQLSVSGHQNNPKASKCTEFSAREEDYSDEPCSWPVMAGYLQYITSPQAAFFDILKDQWLLGFEGSFEKHIGMTLDEFYADLNRFLRSLEPGQNAPDEFFMPDTPLRETIDFSYNGLAERKSSRSIESAEKPPFDVIIGAEGIMKVKGTETSDIFKIEPGNGYKVIKRFDPAEDQISFCGSPDIKLITSKNDTYISEGNDLQAIIKGVDDSQFVVNGIIISGV